MNNNNSFLYSSVSLIIILLITFLLPLKDNLNYGSSNLYLDKLFPEYPVNKVKPLIEQNNYNQPLVNPDFHNIYVPIQESINYSLDNGFKFYDFSRFSSLSLNGHPIAAPYNPSNYFVKSLKAERSIYVKSLLNLIILSIGFMLAIKSFRQDINFNILLFTGTFMVFAPNNMHYVHWDNYLGVLALVPFYIYAINSFIKTHHSKYLFLGMFLSFLQPVINMLEISIYTAVFLFVYLFFLILFFNETKKSEFIKLIFKFILFCFFGFLLALPILIDLYEYSLNILRTPETLHEHILRQPFLPKNIIQYSGFFGMIFPGMKFTQHAFLAPIFFLFAVVFYAFRFKKINSYKERAFLCSLAFLFLFLYTFFIDTPLMASKIYAIFANQSRMISIFYIIFWICAALALDTIFKREVLSTKVLWLVALVQLLIIASLVIILFIGRNFLPLWLVEVMLSKNYLVLYICFIAVGPVLIFLNRNMQEKNKSIVFVFLFCLAFSSSFSKLTLSWEKQPLSKDEYSFSQLKSKTLLIHSSIDNSSNPGEQKIYLGGDISAIGLNPVLGYDTGINNRTLKELNLLINKSYQEMWNQGNEKYAQFGSYWLPPDVKYIKENLCNKDGLFENSLRKIGISTIITDLDLGCSNFKFKQDMWGLNLYEYMPGTALTYQKYNQTLSPIKNESIKAFEGDWIIEIGPDYKSINLPIAIEKQAFQVLAGSEIIDKNSIQKKTNGYLIESLSGISYLRIKFHSSYKKWLYIQLLIISFIIYFVWIIRKHNFSLRG